MSENEENASIENIKAELQQYTPNTKKRIIEKVILALLGSIPWIGNFLSNAATFKTEESSIKTSSLQTMWLEEHEKKFKKLLETLSEIDRRFALMGDQIEERINSEEYLSLVRKSFRVWEDSETDEKKRYVANLLTNSAGTKLCSDDVIRLFIDWLNIYHELHFAVIRAIHKTPGMTRYSIWCELKDSNLPREDSSDADLFKYIIRELSTGGVIRQARDTTDDGRFIKHKPVKSSFKTGTMKSAFDDSEQYMLTGLGQQFVHYTMNEAVSKIEGRSNTDL
ncbi:MAG: hypothetical protein FWD54_04480 [Endomicrobia bacterium]|nr:hypothetical protein [Endomicrobiia bacterium]